jgi:hypothetical protein
MSRIRDIFGGSEELALVLSSSVGSGATATVDVDVTGYAQLTIIWTLQSTTVPGDLTVNDLRVLDIDDTTAVSVAQPPVRTVAPASDTVNVNATSAYDCRGWKKVRILGKNNNVGAKTLQVRVLLGK